MKIKPCPFCWSEDVKYSSLAGRVFCKDCQARGPCGATDKDAIKKWNDAPRKEDVEMAKNCGNCLHISKEVDGKVYCTEEVDADYSCKYWETVNPFESSPRLCWSCKYNYVDDECAMYCGREIGNPKGYVCDKWSWNDNEKESISTPLNPSNSSGLDVIGEIVTRTLFPSNVRQLIEEAAELIVACNKYIRATGSGQPTPVSEDEALAMIAEELADVHIVGEVLMRENSGMEMFYHDAVNRKPLRWKRRLDGEEQDHTEPGD